MKAQFLVTAMLLSTGAQAQSPKAPARQANVGTWAELEERAWVEDLRTAIHGTSGKGVASERAVGQELARCVVSHAPENARTVVLEMIPSGSVRQRFPRLLQCSDDNAKNKAMAAIEIPSPTLQLWLADALVRREYAGSGPGSFDNVAVAQPASSPAKSGLSDVNWNVLRKLGECIARRDAEAVRKLAQTDVATPGEKTAFAALAPTMAMCLPPGSTLRLRTGDVRGSALLSYYQLAHRANGAGGVAR